MFNVKLHLSGASVQYNNFLNSLIEESYILKDKMGYNTKIKKDILALRHYNLNTINFNFHKHISNICYQLVENDKLFTKCYYNSTKMNISGLLIQNEFNNDNLLNSYYKYTNFSKIGDITKISINKNCILTCKNHNLEAGDFIMISNSSLPINGVYATTLNIIDNDNFTLSINSVDFKINLNLGELYGKVKLNLDKTTNKLVLFNDKEIEKNDYIDIINTNIPNDDEIYLHKLSHIDDLSELLFLHTNILNNKINNNNYINLISKLNDKITNVLSNNLNFSNLNIIKKSIINDFIFSDKLFYSDIVIKNYGNYYLKDKKEDKTSIRLNWVNQQIDNGEFYYLYIIKHIYENNIIKIFEINTNIYKKELEELEVKLGKYEDDCSIYKVKNLEDIDNPTIGQIAIINSEDDGINFGNIYVYNNKWEFVKVDKSKTIEEICLFDLNKNIKTKDITCEYINEQCVNRKKFHLQEQYNKTKILYDKLLNVLDKNTIILNINKEYDYALKKLKLLLYKPSANKKNIDFSPTKENKLIKIKIIKDILSMSDKTKMKILLYNIISLDGITINNEIYSKKFQLPMICGHWNYFKKIEFSNNLSDKKYNTKKLYELYTDKENEGYLNCKYCGALFNLVDYDEVDGFTSDGHLKTTRTEAKNDIKLAVKSKGTFNVNCDNDKIQELLLKYKFDLSNFKNFKIICDIVKLLCDKLNIELREEDYIKILIQTNKDLNKIEKYVDFKKIQMIKLVRKGKKNLIPKLEKLNVFKNEYLKYYNLEKYSIVLSLLLLFIQYSIPKYKIIHPKTNCNLSSIDEYDGVNFISCIIKESKSLDIETIQENKKKILLTSEEDINKKITNKYNEYIKLSYIQELIKTHNKNNIKNTKIIKNNTNIKYISNVKDEPNKLPNNFNEYLIGKKGIPQKDDYFRFFKRVKFLNTEIINIINYVVKQNLNDYGCCAYSTNSSFIEFIKSKNKNIEAYLNELKLYDNFKDLFAYKSNFTILKPKHRSTDYYEIPFSLTDTILNNTLKYYNFGGEFSGKKRFYKKLYNNKYDIISGKFEKDIKKERLNEDNYYKLLNDIQDYNYKKFKNPEYKLYDTYYDSLKERDYIQTINNLVKKITHYLQKDQAFSNDFKEKLKNLGLFYEKIDDKTDKDDDKLNDDNRKIIFNKNKYYVNSIKLLKSYINDYFRKYINMIKNKFVNNMMPSLDEFDDYDDKQDYMQMLTEDNHFFKEFYELNLIFKNIKFDYTYDEINNFNGESDRYNSEFKKIKKQSTNNHQNVSEMLKFILFDFLDKMLYEKEGEIQMNNKSISGERTNTVLSQFIYKVFEKIEFDNNKLFITNDKLQNFTQALIYQNSKTSIKFGIGGKILLSEIHGETDDDKLKDKIDDFRKSQYEKMEEITERAKDTAKKEGKDLDSQALDDIVDEIMYEEQVNAEEIDEYDITQPLEIDEVLDVGNDYGAEDQSMETAGSGITQAQFNLEMDKFNSK